MEVVHASSDGHGNVQTPQTVDFETLVGFQDAVQRAATHELGKDQRGL